MALDIKNGSIWSNKDIIIWTPNEPHKYDSQSGWPSFFDTVKIDSDKDNIERISDRSFGMNRTEVKCKNCDAIHEKTQNFNEPSTPYLSFSKLPF